MLGALGVLMVIEVDDEDSNGKVKANMVRDGSIRAIFWVVVLACIG